MVMRVIEMDTSPTMPTFLYHRVPLTAMMKTEHLGRDGILMFTLVYYADERK